MRTLWTLLVLLAGLELGEQEGDAHGEEEDHHTHHVHEDSLSVLLAVVATVIIEEKYYVMLGNKVTAYYLSTYDKLLFWYSMSKK